MKAAALDAAAVALARGAGRDRAGVKPAGRAARYPLAMKRKRKASKPAKRYGRATPAQTRARARLLKKLGAPELTPEELEKLRAKHNGRESGGFSRTR